MKIKFFPSLRTKGEQAIDRMIIAGAAVLMLIGLATEIDRLDNRHVSGVGGRPVGGTWTQREPESGFRKLAICNSLSKLINPIWHFWLLALISPFNSTTQLNWTELNWSERTKR